MNNATKKAVGRAKIGVAIAKSEYGTRQPEIEVHVPRGTSHRQLRAALYLLAAEIELATPAMAGWIVQVDPTSDERGRVYLELLVGTPAEAERGFDVLQAVVR